MVTKRITVVMKSVVLVYAAITLTIQEIGLAINVVSSIRCDQISCTSAARDCPPWHYCDSIEGTCQPCHQCSDGADVEGARKTPRGNCQDPTFCVESLDSSQDFACPRLRIAEGYICHGTCNACDGISGSYLGTTCRLNCTDGAWEVFSCIFSNDIAVWNVTRKPYWIDYETASPPLPPPTSPTSEPKAGSVAYHLEALVGIVAGTVLGGSVVVFFAIMVVVCVHRRRKPDKSNCIEPPTDGEGEPLAVYTPTPELTHESNNNCGSGKEPQEHEEEDVEEVGDLDPERRAVENEPSASAGLSKRPNLPTEDTTYSTYYDGELPSLRNSQFWDPVNPHPPGSVPVDVEPAESLISLRTERSYRIPPRQPEEHSPPPVDSHPAGSSDSGHPPCRGSSSNSLQQETMPKPVPDQGREFRRVPVELSQETSSGFYPPSFQDANTGFHW